MFDSLIDSVKILCRSRTLSGLINLAIIRGKKGTNFSKVLLIPILIFGISQILAVISPVSDGHCRSTVPTVRVQSLPVQQIKSVTFRKIFGKNKKTVIGNL